MKKLLTTLLAITMTISFGLAALAAEAGHGEVKGLVGRDGIGEVNYNLTNQFSVIGNYQNDAYRAGIKYQPSQQIALTVGDRYDQNTKDTNPYAQMDFSIPFGTNLKIVGFYDYNYLGQNWDRYETAIRIQMYPNAFLYAGVWGDDGADAPGYVYKTDTLSAASVNQTNRVGEAVKGPFLFLRGDFDWQWKSKYELRLQPMLNIGGQFFHDYDFKYIINDQTKLVFNVNSQFDQIARYRVGVEYKF